MTIYLYSGVPGSSKSAHAVNDVRFALNRPTPRPVIANFKLADDAPVKRRDLYHYVPNSMLTTKMLTDFATEFWETHDFHEDYLTLVLDECQLLFNSRLWTQKDRLSWLEFFSQSRKWGYKVIFIAQSARMVDNQFRMLIEYEVNHRRVQSMGIIGGVLGMLTLNRLFMQVTYLFQTQERLGSQLFFLRNADMRMYETRKTFDKQERT